MDQSRENIIEDSQDEIDIGELLETVINSV